MFTQLLRAKLHQARVTAADVNYIGSITIDADLLDQTGILEYERVQIADIENGNRLETYVLAGEKGSGVIQLNGAAAHLVNIGDKVIIMAYAMVELPLKEAWVPKVAVLNEHNKIINWIVRGERISV